MFKQNFNSIFPLEKNVKVNKPPEILGSGTIQSHDYERWIEVLVSNQEV